MTCERGEGWSYNQVVKNVTNWTARALIQEAASTTLLQSIMWGKNVRRGQESGVFIEISQLLKYWLLIQPKDSDRAKPRMSVDCIQLMSHQFMISDM